MQYFTEQQKVEESNMNIGIMIIAIVGGATGLLSGSQFPCRDPVETLSQGGTQNSSYTISLQRTLSL